MQRRKVQMSAYVARFNGSSENLIQINRHHRSNEMDGQLTIGYFPQEKHGCGFHWLITNYYQSIKCTILSILQFKGGKSMVMDSSILVTKEGRIYVFCTPYNNAPRQILIPR